MTTLIIHAHLINLKVLVYSNALTSVSIFTLTTWLPVPALLPENSSILSKKAVSFSDVIFKSVAVQPFL